MIPNINLYFYNYLTVFLILLFTFTTTIKAQPNIAEEYVKKGISFQMKSTKGSAVNIDSSSYYFEKARELYKTSGDWEHFVSVSLRLAHCLSLLDNSIAISKLNETAALMEEIMYDSPLLEGIYELTAKLYKAENMFTEAFYELNKLLRSQINIYGRQDNKVAVTYYQIGLYYFEYRIYQQAISAFKKALDIRKNSGRKSEQPILYKNLAQCCKEIGEFESCVAYLDSAISISDQVFKMPTNDLYNQFGLIYCQVGEYQKAKLAFEKSKLPTANSRVSNTYKLIPVYISMAEILIAEGDYINAGMYLDKAEDLISRSSDGYFQYREYFLTRIELMIIMENFDEAFNYLEKYKTYMESGITSDASLLELYSLLGTVYFHRKEYDLSLSYFKKILLFYAENPEKPNPRFNKIYKVMGEIYAIRGEYNSAAEYLKKSLEVNKRLYGVNSTYAAESHISISRLNLKQKNYDKALQDITEACTALGLNVKDLNVISDKRIKDMNDKTILFEAMNYYNEIIEEYYRKTRNAVYIKDLQAGYIVSAALLDNLKNELEAEESKFYWTEKTHSFFEKAIVTLIEFYYNTSDTSLLETAFSLTEKSKSNLILNSMNQAKAKRNLKDSDSLVCYETALINEMNNLRRLIHNEKEKILADSVKLNIWDKKLLNNRFRILEIKKQLKEKYKDLTSGERELTHISLRNVSNKIKDDEVLLNYFMGKRSLIIFSIEKDDYKVTDIQDSTLCKDVETYYELLQKRASLTRNNNKELFLRLSNDLYNQLLLPALKYFNQVRKLIIIPSGKLNLLPFETLISTKKEKGSFTDQAYIIKKYEVVYNYSATLYLQENVNRVYQTDFVGFAPVFNTSLDTGNTIVTELPYSIREVENIQNIFSNYGQTSRTFLAQQATEEEFRRNITHSSSIIHIASHSYSDTTHPDQSGIHFYYDDTSGQDGFLSADEIYNLSSNTNLIVLSSCQGGVGKFIPGEGVLSITRGFLHSGVPNLIFSLWDVGDRTTYNLMTGFYTHLVKGNDFSQALRSAKLEMLSNEFTSSPDSWSSFIMIETAKTIN